MQEKRIRVKICDIRVRENGFVGQHYLQYEYVSSSGDTVHQNDRQQNDTLDMLPYMSTDAICRYYSTLGVERERSIISRLSSTVLYLRHYFYLLSSIWTSPICPELHRFFNVSSTRKWKFTSMSLSNGSCQLTCLTASILNIKTNTRSCPINEWQFCIDIHHQRITSDQS